MTKDEAIEVLIANYPSSYYGKLREAAEFIERLPPVQPGRYEWNPIKDGLPDEEGVYFVTDDAGGMGTVYLDVFSHYEDGSLIGCTHKM